MKAYLDTSVLLRLVLREPGGVDVRAFDDFVSSEIIAIESHRTIDRMRVLNALTAEEASARVAAVTDWLEAIDLVLLRAPILDRAAHPLPTALGTLDAIHLATALVWRERSGAPIVMATHDQALAVAARSFGFDVVGV